MPPLPELTEDHMRRFGSWLLLNPELPGAELLYNHYSNPRDGGQNRQGHFKQSFFAAYRFICEYPQLRDQLAQELDNLVAQDGVLNLQAHPALAQWLEHLRRHAQARGELWDYSVLRRHLPASLGGTRGDGGRGDGGGGSGTLQRMLPVLARYMREKNLP